MTSNPSPLAGDLVFLPLVKTVQGQPVGVREDGVLYLVFLALLTGLKLLREQGTQQLDNDPQHSRSQQGEDEHEHQHKGGGNEKLYHALYLGVLECGGGGWI